MSRFMLLLALASANAQSIGELLARIAALEKRSAEQDARLQRHEDIEAVDGAHVPPNTVHSAKFAGNQKMDSILIQEPGGNEERAADAAANVTPAQSKDRRGMERLRDKDDF